MKDKNNYYETIEINPLLIETINEKGTIHELEKNSVELNLDKLSSKKAINALR